MNKDFFFKFVLFVAVSILIIAASYVFNGSQNYVRAGLSFSIVVSLISVLIVYKTKARIIPLLLLLMSIAYSAWFISYRIIPCIGNCLLLLLAILFIRNRRLD